MGLKKRRCSITMAGSPALLDTTAMPQSYIKRILDARVYDVARETPVDEAVLMSRRLDNQVWLKREDLQPVFSFKLRGAYNKMYRLSEEQRSAAWWRPRRVTTPRAWPWRRRK